MAKSKTNKPEAKKKFRKRPNLAEIKKQGELRGHLTCNEETTLLTIELKNSLQRMWNRTMDDALSKTECNKLQKAMKTFLAEVDEVIPKRGGNGK